MNEPPSEITRECGFDSQLARCSQVRRGDSLFGKISSSTNFTSEGVSVTCVRLSKERRRDLLGSIAFWPNEGQPCCVGDGISRARPETRKRKWPWKQPSRKKKKKKKKKVLFLKKTSISTLRCFHYI
jgi:hypothetical protein